ncbi:peptide/nickel transport system permease protein [Rathayibacter oskolensis]|uniref:Peptide/nickel transport system permease protein n=1 Tax=Rathayibacter oskolensis TaxID=1891671 RepID=A0A1X7PG32_9MICO|nr:ABC transporter permease [Rathayibacter oskolensis]SMH50425.1 peptide/nickel transport system permease protein [Rathayibacter oskolensis]
MARLILMRIAISIPVLFIMTILTFFLASLVPGDAATTILGQDATPERIAELNEQLGLNRPILEQYWDWLAGIFRGDLGSSLYSGEEVTRLIGQRFWPTFFLAAFAALVSAVIGVAFGIVAAVKGGWTARALDGLGMLGISLPNFWVALLLIVFFSGTLGLFPAVGYTAPEKDFGGFVSHLVLPVAALSIAGVALIAKQTRESMAEALSRDFMRFMQANGIPRRQLIFKYGLRYASIPILATISATFVTHIGGTVTLESVFAIPGMGSLVARSTTNHDLSTIQGAVLTFTVAILIVNIVTDVIYSFLNPKVKAA